MKRVINLDNNSSCLEKIVRELESKNPYRVMDELKTNLSKPVLKLAYAAVCLRVIKNLPKYYVEEVLLLLGEVMAMREVPNEKRWLAATATVLYYHICKGTPYNFEINFSISKVKVGDNKPSNILINNIGGVSG